MLLSSSVELCESVLPIQTFPRTRSQRLDILIASTIKKFQMHQTRRNWRAQEAVTAAKVRQCNALESPDRVLTVAGMECGVFSVVDDNGEGNMLGAGRM